MKKTKLRDLTLRFIFASVMGIVLAGAPFPALAQAESQGKATAKKRISEKKLFDQSVELFQKKDYAAAARILKFLTRKRPEKALYWFNLGNSQFMLGELQEAQEAYRQVIELKSPLAPAAELYLAKVLRTSGEADKQKALVILRKLLEKPLPPALRKAAEAETQSLQETAEAGQPEEDTESDPEARALALYKDGRHGEALRTLGEAGKKLSENGQLLKGMILIRLNREEQARRVLGRLVRRAPDDQIQDSARSLLDRLGPIESTPYWAYADLGLGYNSNVFLAANGTDAEAHGVLRFNGGAGYRFFEWESFSTRLNLGLQWDETEGVESLRTVQPSLHVPMVVATKTWSASLSPSYQRLTWGHDEVSSRLGVHARVERLGPLIAAGFELDGSKQESFATGPSYLNGTILRGRVFAGWIRPQSYVEVFIDASDEKIGDLEYTDGLLPLAYRGLGGGARGIAKVTDQWILSLQISRFARDYRTLAQPNGKKREDNETDLSLKVHRSLSKRTTAYLSADFTDNSSSLGENDIQNKNYRVYSVFTGLAWDVW